MAGNMQGGADAIVMDEQDHVATCLRNVEAGETIVYRKGEQLIELKTASKIPFGHKAAIVDIPSGTDVRKYGEVIGRSTSPIARGEHVHVHNIEGIRGRGDQAKKGESA
jgi:altronate dehydratase small subunit